MTYDEITKRFILGVSQKMAKLEESTWFNICAKWKQEYEDMPSHFTLTEIRYNPVTNQFEEYQIIVINNAKLELFNRAKLFGCEWANEVNKRLIKVLSEPLNKSL